MLSLTELPLPHLSWYSRLLVESARLSSKYHGMVRICSSVVSFWICAWDRETQRKRDTEREREREQTSQ